jgi:hypothetical protein
VARELGIEPLAWNAQAITVSYERARGMRAVGERGDGFAVTVSRTVGVPVEQLYDAFADAALRDRWGLRERTATRPRSARFDHGDDGTRVTVTFAPKEGARSVATVEHSRLPSPEDAERTKALWRERLTGLRARLEAGESRA